MKPNEQNTPSGTARPNDRTQPRKDVPPAFDREPRDPRETAPDIGKKPDAGKPYQPAKDETRGPTQAARGDDDLMSTKPGKPE